LPRQVVGRVSTLLVFARRLIFSIDLSGSFKADGYVSNTDIRHYSHKASLTDRLHLLFKKLLPPFRNIRCFSFIK
jgi:hypothetical protein